MINFLFYLTSTSPAQVNFLCFTEFRVLLEEYESYFTPRSYNFLGINSDSDKKFCNRNLDYINPYSQFFQHQPHLAHASIPQFYSIWQKVRFFLLEFFDFRFLVFGFFGKGLL